MNVKFSGVDLDFNTVETTINITGAESHNYASAPMRKELEVTGTDADGNTYHANLKLLIYKAKKKKKKAK